MDTGIFFADFVMKSWYLLQSVFIFLNSMIHTICVEITMTGVDVRCK